MEKPPDVALACRDLHQNLENIIKGIEGLKRRKRLTKVATCLKLYKEEVREKFADALDEFRFRMCAESQKSVVQIDEKLQEMTKTMEDLQITARTLTIDSGAEAVVARIQERMVTLSEEIRKLQISAHETRRELQELQRASASIKSQFERTLRHDSNITRETIKQSTAQVINHVNNVVQGEKNIEKIRLEYVPQPSSLIWYDAIGGKPEFRLWSLDEALHNDDRSEPVAQYGGTELSSVRLNETVESIYAKRHIADDVIDHVNEQKRRRISDVSPYFAIAKRGDYLEELREYMPPSVVDQFFGDVPRDVQLEVLQISRRLGQEYRFAVLDQIMRQKANTLPKLHMVENLERAMLALYAGKLSVSLGFYVEHTIDGANYLFDLCVNVSRYFIVFNL